MGNWGAAILLFACLSSARSEALPARAFDAPRAFQDLVTQCAFGPRVPGTKPHDQCAQWLVAQLRCTADRVTTQRFTQVVKNKPVPLVNIQAVFNPQGKQHILLCAHWDSRPTADADPDPAKRRQAVPGANDGASGVAVLLEIARALKSRPPTDRVTIVLFDGEDYGATVADMLLGSRHYAAHFDGPPVNWAVLLDMVGAKGLRIEQEQNSLAAAGDVVKRVWTAARRAGSSAFVEEKGPTVIDDHVPLIARGIPCVDVIDFDYPQWHTTADTPDQCSAASLDQVGRAILQTIADGEPGAGQKGQ
jgi:hypothetical protein